MVNMKSYEMRFVSGDVVASQKSLGWLIRLRFDNDNGTDKFVAFSFPGRFDLCDTVHDVAEEFRNIADIIERHVVPDDLEPTID